jgi:hypothetical protein
MGFPKTFRKSSDVAGRSLCSPEAIESGMKGAARHLRHVMCRRLLAGARHEDSWLAAGGQRGSMQEFTGELSDHSST